MELKKMIHVTKLHELQRDCCFQRVDKNWYFSSNCSIYIYDHCFCLEKSICFDHPIELFSINKSSHHLLTTHCGIISIYNPEQFLIDTIDIQYLIEQYGLLQSIQWTDCNHILCCFYNHILNISIDCQNAYEEYPSKCFSYQYCGLYQQDFLTIHQNTIYYNDSTFCIPCMFRYIHATIDTDYFYVLCYYQCHFIILVFPITPACDSCLCNMDSVACMEKSLSCILNQEGKKIQYVLNHHPNHKKILETNKSVKDTIDSITCLENTLVKKLQLLKYPK